jgi:RNA polymerase sigma factor (sigma-70 family)
MQYLTTIQSVQRETDKLYKEHFGQLIATLLCSFRAIDPEAAEDIVHDSFSSALTNWTKKGIPLNPAGWIFRVCRNKALNKIRNEKRFNAFSKNPHTDFDEIRYSESILDDQQLKLLFACAHPDLSPKVQIVITLKYVVNLRVDAIAKMLGMTVDGVDKLLARARQRIKEEKILLEEPVSAALTTRLPIVHQIIYLIFNEGYKPSGGKEMFREELCEEALLLNHALIKTGLGNKETAALHALMLFNSARFRSRFTASGDLVDLERQDRQLWNQDLIIFANDYLIRSRDNLITRFHLEASIAYFHCIADTFDSTDWKSIANLYVELFRRNANPFVKWNYAIALYHSGQKNRSFEILNELESHTILNQYHLLNCTLGKFHTTEGNHALAKQFFLKALGQTNFMKEKEFIQKQISQLDSFIE